MENSQVKKKEKSRGKTFLQSEINFLLKLCKNHYETIENKKTDAVTWRIKEKCWETIASEFNSAGIFGMRSATQLHNKWNLLKKTARKEYAEERRNLMSTGGGEFKPSNISEVSKKIHEMNAETIEGGTNRFDSDAIEVEPIAGCSSDINVEHESPESRQGPSEPNTFDEMLDLDIVEAEKENSWEQFTPSSLKQHKHPLLDVGSTPSVKRRFTTNAKNVVKTHADMVNAKLEVAAIQKEYFKKLVEVQNLEEANKKEQHEWSREEHEVKMQILHEELKQARKKSFE